MRKDAWYIQKIKKKKVEFDTEGEGGTRTDKLGRNDIMIISVPFKMLNYILKENFYSFNHMILQSLMRSHSSSPIGQTYLLFSILS